MAVSSARNLMTGSGTVSTTSGSKVLTFSLNQSFKEGATVLVDPAGSPQSFTIDSGSGTTWAAMQDATATVSGKSFKPSQTSTSRARGGSTVKWAPNAKHFAYMAPVDGSGNPDWYTYIDTLYPEKGVHPYTRDRWTGIVRTTDKIADSINDAVLIPDLAERLKALDGLPAVYTL